MSSSTIPMSPDSGAVDDLDLMFERALTGSDLSRGDQLAIEALATLVRSHPALTRRLAEKIAERLHVSSAIIVSRTIDMLDTCMHSAGDPFRHEIARFKFLNEIVRLLSPTKAVRPVAPAIQQRLMDLMLMWTAQYPRCTKIREAYDMLRKQGVSHEMPSDHSVAQQVRAQRPAGKERSVFDAIPGELLRSQNPADIQTAKLLIKQALEREQREEMLREQHRAEIREALEAATVLNDVLTEGASREMGTEERQLARELYDQCRALQMTVSRFAEISGGSEGAGTAASATAEHETVEAVETRRTEMAELLQANDALQSAIQRYKSIVQERRSDAQNATPSSNAKINATPTALSNTDILTAALSNAQLSDDVLTALHSTTSSLSATDTGKPMVADLLDYDGGTTDLSALDKIFTSTKSETGDVLQPAAELSDVMLLLQKASTDQASLLAPIGASPQQNVETTTKTKICSSVEKPVKPLSELDMFGLESVITGLKNHLVNNSDKHDIENAAVNNDIETFAKISVETVDNAEPNLLSSSSSDIADDPTKAPFSLPAAPLAVSLTTPLAELHVDLATIQPAAHPPRIVLDDTHGLKVVLHFARDRPRPDCSVCVLTVTNQAGLPVRDLRIDASVSKPCKVRLLAASGLTLPACRPFKPPTEDITQLLLVANSTDQPYDLLCILSYYLGNDPDQCKESISVQALPAFVQ